MAAAAGAADSSQLTASDREHLPSGTSIPSSGSCVGVEGFEDGGLGSEAELRFVSRQVLSTTGALI